MTDDLLSKIKQKAQQRKDVPTRNTSLLGSSSPGSPSPELEITQNVQAELTTLLILLVYCFQSS